MYGICTVIPFAQHLVVLIVADIATVSATKHPLEKQLKPVTTKKYFLIIFRNREFTPMKLRLKKCNFITPEGTAKVIHFKICCIWHWTAHLFTLE